MPVRYLSLAEVLELHRRIIDASGGARSLRDPGALESAVAQPRASFGGEDLYPDLAAKAPALALSLIGNHPSVDGNKRVGHAALETFLLLNGHELNATVDASERIVLGVAAGGADRDALLAFVRAHLVAAIQPRLWFPAPEGGKMRLLGDRVLQDFRIGCRHVRARPLWPPMFVVTEFSRSLATHVPQL